MPCISYQYYMWLSLVFLKDLIETEETVGGRQGVKCPDKLIAWQTKCNTGSTNGTDFSFVSATGLLGSLLQLYPFLCSSFTISVQQQCLGKNMLMIQGTQATLFQSDELRYTCLVLTNVRMLLGATLGFTQHTLTAPCH